MYGLTFNGKHSINDFGLIMDHKYIYPPSKIKIKQQVPYMNYFYDFSTVGTNGDPVFDSRKIEVKFGLISRKHDKKDLQNLYTQVCEWLMDCNQSQLKFDDIPDYYFTAEVEEVSSWEELQWWGFITADFITEPFKEGVSQVGTEQLWDPFNFETDYLQDTEFDVNGSKEVTIYNPGRPVTPQLSCNAQMVCTLNGYITTFPVGDSIDYEFKLQNGANTIQISGAGHVSFNFRKETL